MVEKIDLSEKQESIDTIEKSNLPEGVCIMEIRTDSEIIDDRDAISKLEVAGQEFGNGAEDFFPKINWKEKKDGSYRVVQITLQQLFKDDYRDRPYFYDEIKDKAKELGLNLVPAYLVPEITINYPKDRTSTTIATEVMPNPSDISDKYTYLFLVQKNSIQAIGVDDWVNDDDSFFFIQK